MLTLDTGARESGRLLLNDRQRQIIPVAAFVIGLEVVTSDGDDSAIREVGESATNWSCGGVIDNRKGRTGCKGLTHLDMKRKGCASDRHAAGFYLIAAHLI